MKYKKSIAIGLSVALLTTTGISIAAGHSQPLQHADSKKALQSKVMDTSTDTDPAVTTESQPTIPIDQQAPAPVTTVAPQPTDTTPAPSAYDTFHQDVTNWANSIYPYFANQSPSQSDFVYLQWYCLGRGLDNTTDASVFDGKRAFMTSSVTDSGQTQYQAFGGGCRVVYAFH